MKSTVREFARVAKNQIELTLSTYYVRDLTLLDIQNKSQTTFESWFPLLDLFRSDCLQNKVIYDCGKSLQNIKKGFQNIHILTI